MTDSDQPATRGDLETLRTELRTDIRTAIASSEARVIGELRTEIQTVRTELCTEIQTVRTELRTEIGRVIDEIGAASQRTANVVLEHGRDNIRVATDHTSAVADRVTVLDGKVDAHVADDARHRVPRTRRRAR